MSKADFFFVFSVVSVTANILQHLRYKAVRHMCSMHEQFILVLMKHIATGETPPGLIIHKCEKKEKP